MPYRTSLSDALSEWLTDREVAALLNISARTLPQWRHRGKFKDDLPHYKIGRSVRYRRADVEAFVTQCRVGGTTPPEQRRAAAAPPEQ